MPKKKKSTFTKWILVLTGVSIFFGGIALIQHDSAVKEDKTKTEEVEWTDERLYKEEEVVYSLVDQGILEFEDGLRDWVASNRDNAGVYSESTDEHTYILVSAGEEGQDKAVQLYDVRTDEEHLFVGYSFVDGGSEVVEEEGAEIEIPFMLIRLEKSDKAVEGRLIIEVERN